MGRMMKYILGSCLFALLVACGGASVIRGEPPQVTINSLARTDSGLILQLRFRNINQEPLVITEVRFTFTLDDHPLKSSEAGMQLYIDASTSEVSSFTLPLTDAVDARLRSVESGELASLQHEFKGDIIDQQGERLDFQFRGHLYPVPGRPGKFR